MIKPEERYFTDSVGYMGPWDDPSVKTWSNIIDWDQLRMIKIRGTAKLFRPEEDIEISVLGKFIDHLSPDVTSVTVDDDGLLVAVSTDAKEDDTDFIGYIPFSNAISLADSRTIRYSELKELDRLGPMVDLSSYKDESGIPKKVAFKFNAMGKIRREMMLWDELHALKSIPPHPNILGLDRVVLEDVESRIIGFTTEYIPGGTLENIQIPFRLEWLKQLTEVVDYLNLELGLVHQDVAPRNLLINPNSNRILLFDFNWVAREKKALLDGRDDVAGVVFTLHEIITNDFRFAETPHDERNIAMVQDLSDWPCKRELDSEVSVFRSFLDEWVAKRNSLGNIALQLNPWKQVSWPDLPTAPDYNVPFILGKLWNGEPRWVTGRRSRRTALSLGQYCFRWERPLQSRLLKQSEEAVTPSVQPQ